MAPSIVSFLTHVIPLFLVPLTGVVDVRNFQKGLYRCGKDLLSTNAGMPCTTFHNCTTNVEGVFA